MRLSRSLDWLVIADHSDGMGMVGDIAAGEPELLAYEQAARWNKGLAGGGDAAVQAGSGATIRLAIHQNLNLAINASIASNWDVRFNASANKASILAGGAHRALS